jgi:hypothetical protein
MSWRVLGECVEQAAFDGAGLVAVRADPGGPAQGGHVAGHADLAAGKAAVFALGQVVAPQVPAFLRDGQDETRRPGGQVALAVIRMQGGSAPSTRVLTSSSPAR